MANPRQDNPNQTAHDTVRRTAAAADEMRRTAQETTRMAGAGAAEFGRSALEAGERATRTGAELMHQNAEAVRRIWQSSLQMVSQMGGHSTDEIARAFGLSSDEVRQANEQSSRNVDAIVESSAVLCHGLEGISHEWFEFARKRIEQNLNSVNDLARCRTPQQFAAVHSEMLRDGIEDLLQSTRRVAEISARLAEEATGKMSANLERTKRAA